VPKKIIVDCDPGHDDAIALLLAHGSPDVELVAITTVMGNSTLANVTRNALVVATIGGIRDVPVAAGCARPLVGELKIADAIHGSTGLDGPVLPEPTGLLDPRHAVDVIIETLLREPPGTVTLVPTAALTNIALAVRKEPRIVERVAEVVLMGGAVAGGNWSPTAEFNIATDPEAAHIVFGEDWPVTMVGLDLTHQALATPDVVDRIAAIGTAPARFVTEVLAFFGRTYRAEQGFAHPPVHDPCAVARVIDPAVLTTRRTPVTVELSGRWTRGMTVADLRAPAPPDCRTQVAVDLDHARFWDLVVDALERIGEP
jgi:purine nucleosidase